MEERKKRSLVGRIIGVGLWMLLGILLFLIATRLAMRSPEGIPRCWSNFWSKILFYRDVIPILENIESWFGKIF